MRRKIWTTIKKVWFAIVKVFISAIMIVVVIAGFNLGNIDLKSCNKYSGEVSQIGTVSKKGKQWLYFKLEGLSVTLLSYNISQGYSQITSQVKEGDIVTVYYPQSKFSEIEAYQIEKEDKIVLNKSSFEWKWIFCSALSATLLISALFKKQIKRWINNRNRSTQAVSTP